jgi:hypothetical protein
MHNEDFNLSCQGRQSETRRMPIHPNKYQISAGLYVERLNEHSLEDCLGRQKATAIYSRAGFVMVSTL